LSSYFSPLGKSDIGGFDKIKSPLASLFQRGEIIFYPPLKKGERGGFNRIKGGVVQ